jgi:hypothetical protein
MIELQRNVALNVFPQPDLVILERVCSIFKTRPHELKGLLVYRESQPARVNAFKNQPNDRPTALVTK